LYRLKKCETRIFAPEADSAPLITPSRHQTELQYHLGGTGPSMTNLVAQQKVGWLY